MLWLTPPCAGAATPFARPGGSSPFTESAPSYREPSAAPQQQQRPVRQTRRGQQQQQGQAQQGAPQGPPSPLEDLDWGPPPPGADVPGGLAAVQIRHAAPRAALGLPRAAVFAAWRCAVHAAARPQTVPHYAAYGQAPFPFPPQPMSPYPQCPCRRTGP